MPDRHSIEWIEIATMATGLDLRVAAHRIEGRREGPTVGITAGIHGDELLPIELVRRVLEAVDPAELRGAVVAIPVANPLAFETLTRHTTIDMHNLNRVFPGERGGWITEALAKALSDYLVPKIDVLLDLHAGGSVPTVDYVYALNDLALSRSFLFPTMYRGSSYAGSLGTHVIESTAKPVVVAEVGGGSQLDDDYLRRGVGGVLNALRRLGSIPGDAVPAPRQILLTRMQILRPTHGGILQPEVTTADLRSEVAGGTLLGVTRNPQTFEVVEEFRAPFDRTLLVLVRGVLSKVHAGDYAYMLGDLGTAEVLEAE
jgi:uncharacterized protein